MRALDGLDVTLDGRELRFSVGGAWAFTLVLALPGETVPGFVPDAEGLALTSCDGARARVRCESLPDRWRLVVTADNETDSAVTLSVLGLGVRVAPGVHGWAWASGGAGLVVIALASGRLVTLVLKRGFLRVVPLEPTYPALAGGLALRLAPGTSLGAFKRHEVEFELADAASWADVEALLPRWLPPTVISQVQPIELALPDDAVVPGEGVEDMDWGPASSGVSTTLVAQAGHRTIDIHGANGDHELHLCLAPDLGPWLGRAADELVRGRASSASSAEAFVVAEALTRGSAVDDVDACWTWLDSCDWGERGDLLGIAASGLVAISGRDHAAVAEAWTRLASVPVTRGYGFAFMRLWLASLTNEEAIPEDAASLLSRDATDPDARDELTVLTSRSGQGVEAIMAGLIDELGGPLPGYPIGLDAESAAWASSLLRLAPEGWDRIHESARTAEKASLQLLADAVGPDGGLSGRPLDGLAWLLLGQLGS